MALKKTKDSWCYTNSWCGWQYTRVGPRVGSITLFQFNYNYPFKTFNYFTFTFCWNSESNVWSN